jgi:hypothetical protein
MYVGFQSPKRKKATPKDGSCMQGLQMVRKALRLLGRRRILSLVALR